MSNSNHANLSDRFDILCEYQSLWFYIKIRLCDTAHRLSNTKTHIVVLATMTFCMNKALTYSLEQSI